MSSRTEDGGFMEQQKYCAFISYRHQSPDREIAGRLHTLIENYVSPASVRGKKGAKHPGKVFRDREELPLSSDLGKDIENALDQSEWLIAVCSPRYMESRWCMRELTYFIERHGRERVLTVLAEGEPVAYPLRKGPETETLLAAINEILENARQDGTLAAISAKYLGADLTHSE